MGFRLANIDGRAALVDANGNFHDLERLSAGEISNDPMLAIGAHAALHALDADLGGSQPDGSLADAPLGSPVPRPRNCLAVGLNYASHAAEASMEKPEVPLVFTKFPGCIVGPNDDVVLDSTTADWEAELVVVIGTECRNVSRADAWAHVAGLTIGQDISDRLLQFAAKPPHFDLAKSRDTYGPMGPVLVSHDLVTDKDAMSIRCMVNGDIKQDATSADLIFDVPALVEYISSIMTLRVGDIIFTGTPDGVGATSGTFLRDGDEIVTTIEGIGTMTNRCVA